MHGIAIIVPMVHQRRSQSRLSQTGDTQDTDDMSRLLAPRLAYFAGVARTEHVTRAAQEMQVPQSTLSRAMVRLEQDLGVELFARHGRTVSLTPAGRTFLTSVERALAEIERAADEVRADADPATGKVAFGFLHTMGAETVPGLLHAFRADHPRIRFSLVQNYGEAMLEGLRAGEEGEPGGVPVRSPRGRARLEPVPGRSAGAVRGLRDCLLYTSPSPRD